VVAELEDAMSQTKARSGQWTHGFGLQLIYVLVKRERDVYEHMERCNVRERNGYPLNVCPTLESGLNKLATRESNKCLS
jgi:hypothetical protein